MKFAWSLVVALCVTAVLASTGLAQTKPVDNPSLSVGATLFTDYTYTQAPTAKDGDDNAYHPSAFNVTRSYININGKISPAVTFRLTPDIVRETGTGSSLAGSLTFRVKYAFAQIAPSKSTWVRLGIQQTPYVDYTESIYRYRFQGTIFSDREGFTSSSDAGASFHATMPSNYGDVHIGVYNGENYNRPEANDQKALRMRASLRPLPKAVTGLRVTGYYDTDHYVQNAGRKRLMANVTFEGKRLNAGAEYLDTKDQVSVSKAETQARGYSVWATPKFGTGLEALLRYDHLKPNEALNQSRNRTILGLAYWFPHVGSVSSALLLDYERQTFTATAVQEKIAARALVNF